MKEALKWVAGVLFSLTALASIGLEAFLSVPFYAMASALCFPPLLSLIQKKLKIQLQTWSKYVLVIGFWIIGGVFFPDTKKKSEPQKDGVKSEPVFVRDTIFVRDTVWKIKTVSTHNPEKMKADTSKAVSISNSIAPKTYSKPQTRSKRSSSKSGYITGPRGGCYYINGNGKKVYVDRSYCQ